MAFYSETGDEDWSRLQAVKDKGWGEVHIAISSGTGYRLASINLMKRNCYV